MSESDAQASSLFIPLLFISVLFVGALPFYVRQPVVSGESVSGPAWFGGAHLGEPAADVYWLCALPVCIGAVAVYCVWSERRRASPCMLGCGLLRVSDCRVQQQFSCRTE
ncbi:hypothetical protein CH281_09630 [Rhodococcus sp. 06-221-2]|nr:hypothetical protein CH281_09630 [Rhodococcus sp. 06-221-2]